MQSKLQPMSKDEWDLLAEAFDKWLEQTTEDGIPLWMIEERNTIQQIIQHEKIIDSSKPDAGNAIQSGSESGY